MKRRGYRATNFLLLAICCVWCHTIQPTLGGKCSGQWAIHACAGGNGKRSDVSDVAQLNDLGGAGEGPDIEEGRGGEITGGKGGRERDGLQGTREDDDLKSEFNDLMEKWQKLNIGSRRLYRPPPPRAPLGSALGRLRSMLRATRLDDDEGVEEQHELEEKEQEEPPRSSRTDTNTRYINRNTLTMLRRILDDITRKLDSQPSLDSMTGERDYRNLIDSPQKRAVNQSPQKGAANQLTLEDITRKLDAQRTYDSVSEKRSSKDWPQFQDANQ